MIFWIVLALLIAGTIYMSIRGYWSDGGSKLDAFMYGFLTLMFGGLAGCGLVAVLSIWFGPTAQLKSQADYELVALQTSQTIHGRTFFLGSGYINGVRTLNYITNEDGTYRVQSADADDSVIHQDATEPTVTDYTWSVENPWFAPWSFGNLHTYDFHVPEGSILSDYTIDNQ